MSLDQLFVTLKMQNRSRLIPSRSGEFLGTGDDFRILGHFIFKIVFRGGGDPEAQKGTPRGGEFCMTCK